MPSSILDGFKMLESLGSEEKAQLEIFCQEKIMVPGEILFDEGDEGNAMYFLKQGEIEVSKLINGERLKLGTISAEDILGEMALFGDTEKRMARASVKKKTTLITMLSFSIKELTQKHPEVLKKIKEIIEERHYQNKIAVNNRH